jgi:hypothetical protein
MADKPIPGLEAISQAMDNDPISIKEANAWLAARVRAGRPRPSRQEGPPPAFPNGLHGSGMSLRDWFAGQVAAGLVPDRNTLGYGLLAGIAYELADALLAAREGKP